MKRKHLDIVIILFLCVLFIWRFIFYDGNTTSQNQSSEITNTVTDETIPQAEEFSSLQTPETTIEPSLSTQADSTSAEEIWDKIIADYLSCLELVDTSPFEGTYVKNYGEEVRQNDWLYTIQGAYITKKKNEIWDFVPDFSRYVYDENNNLINEYSYVALAKE